MKTIDDVAGRFWASTKIVSSYTGRAELDEVEKAVFARYRERILGRRLLDVGVGAGRTTPHLLALTKNYVGIDYSVPMIKTCERSFPAVEFYVCDARDLGRFRDGEFGTVVFSFNGIDNASAQDRSKILREIHRVLNDGGLFIFSSLNRACRRRSALDPRNIRLHANPYRTLRSIAGYVAGISNYQRLRHLERISGDCELRVGTAFHYSIVNAVMYLRDIVAQLTAHGFRDVKAFGTDGNELRQEDEPEDQWIYYAALKQRL